MQRAKIVLAAGLAAAAATLVSAAAKPKLRLQPTGRTVGGPVAVRNLQPGQGPLAFFTQGFAEGGLDLCVTVLNTGQGALQFRIFGDASGQVFLDAGEGQTFCASDVDNADAVCAEGGPACSYEWRMDEVSTGT